MKKDFLNIIQISDMHLFANIEETLLGVKTDASFQAVVDLINAQKNKIDLILLSGDIAQDGSLIAYKRLASILKIFNCPVYCVPGNHDNVAVMQQVYPYETVLYEKHIILKNWQIILLNSQKVGQIHGWLDQKQLIHLQKCLQAHPNLQTIIMFHHQPTSIGAKWLDNHGLKNSDEFWDIISSHQNVNTILFGHVHQEFEQIIQGIKCYSVPSTCFQFMRNQHHFGLENLPPGYRWIHLYQDGRLETGIKRTAEYIGVFDKDAKGY